MDTTGIAIVLVAPASALVATDVEILGFWLVPHGHAQSGGLEWHAGNRGVARGTRPAGDIGLQDATPILMGNRKAPRDRASAGHLSVRHADRDAAADRHDERTTHERGSTSRKLGTHP